MFEIRSQCVIATFTAKLECDELLSIQIAEDLEHHPVVLQEGLANGAGVRGSRLLNSAIIKRFKIILK